jgi:hypothetical protein
MQCACAILLSVACPVVLYYSTYVINGTTFGEHVNDVKCMFWLSLDLPSETSLILRRIGSNIFINVQGHLRKEPPAILLRIQYNFNPLNPKLNPICHLLALLGAHPILHVSRISVNILGRVLKNTQTRNENPSIGSRVVPFGRKDRRSWRR